MTEEKKENKLLQGEYHSLFQEVVDEKRETKEIDNKSHTVIIPKFTKFRFFITSFHDNEKGLHAIFNTLWTASENDTLELRINSHGGSVKEGKQIAHIIKNKFFGRTTTILDSCGYSMGALTFCLGDERIVTEYSDLMFHDYSGWSCGKGQEIESEVEHNKKHIREFFKKIIVGSNFLTADEFKHLLIGKDYWMDATEMCRRGIATHILIDGKKIKAKKYLKQLKKAKL